MKKNKKEVLVITIMILVLIIGITYAYFKIVKEASFNMSIYDFDITFNDGNLINSKNLYPIEDNKITSEGIRKDFTMAKKNNTDKDVYTKISLVDIELDNDARDKDLRWRLLRNNVILTEGSFVNLGDNNKLELATNIKLTTTKSDTYTLYIWIQETNYPQRESLMDKSIKAKIEVEGMLSEYRGIPNEGKLDNGMIPVIYDWDQDVWIKAGGSLGWYDYDKQIWANAVTVYPDHRNEYMESEVGTPINMEDINSMWVWIPRYKYKIPSSIGLGKGTTTPPEIDVIFETGTEATGVSEKDYRAGLDGCESNCTNENYYTHPAFRDGSKVFNEEAYDIGGWDKELTGIWVGKFETGGTTTEPLIKPEIVPLTNKSLKDKFITALKFTNRVLDDETSTVTRGTNLNGTYGLNMIYDNSDTHVIKNTEWGAVAYLYHSKYGKIGNPNYKEGYDNEVYKNPNRITGRSVGSDYHKVLGTFTYNNKKVVNNEVTEEKTPNAGTGASTSGTIYGIYDIGCGVGESIMANLNRNVGNSGFKVMPEQKYYDLYKGTTHGINSVLGDATWETAHWYNEYYGPLPNPWHERGAWASNYGDGGLFAFNTTSGGASTVLGLRTVLIL